MFLGIASWQLVIKILEFRSSARWLCFARSHLLQQHTGTGRNGQGRPGTGTRREGAAVAVSFQDEAWIVSEALPGQAWKERRVQRLCAVLTVTQHPLRRV